MADILIHSTVPSLSIQTESASNLLIDIPKNDSPSTNKYNGHVNRLRHVFTEQSLISNDQSTKSMTNNRQEQSPKQLTDITPNRSYHEDISYAIVNRKYSNSETHYDFPADAIEQLKKQQREETEIHLIPSFLPSNVVKRMNHLNTIFVKPTKIERILPKLIFQDDDDDNKQEQAKPIESSILNGKEII